MSDAYGDDDEHAFDADADALARLIARLRREADEPSADLAQRRARFDRSGARRALPAGWIANACALGRPAERLSGPSAAANRTLLYLHGGGFCLGSLASHRALAAQLAHAAQAAAYTLDYRLAPEHPFPAAIEDVVEAYRRLLADGRAPHSIVLIGDCAGGALAIAATLRAKQIGLPTPLGLVAISPWTDLSLSGETLRTRAQADPILRAADLRAMAAAYLAATDAKTALASPLFADLAGLPPLLIHVGNDDILLSDSERFVNAARAAGVDATVEIWPGLFHVWHDHFDEIDEAREGVSEIGAWLMRRWK